MTITVVLLLASGMIHAQNEDERVILTSNTVVKDVVENLVGNLVEVKSLYPVGGQSWRQDGLPWPKDLKVDLVIYEEGEKIYIPKGVSSWALPSQSPKSWLDLLSPAYTQVQLNLLSYKLMEAFPEFSEEIAFNKDLFRSDLQTVDSLIAVGFDTLNSTIPFIIEDRSLTPFCRRYGLKCLTPEDARPDFALLLVESTSSPRNIQALADETSWPIIGQVYTRSLSTQDGPAATYLDLLRTNASILRRGLQTEIPEAPEAELPTWMDWRMMLFLGVLAMVTGVMALRVVRKV